MPKLRFKNPSLFTLLFTVMVMVFFGEEVRGQRVYATGTISGGINGTGLLAGAPIGLSRSGTLLPDVGNITLLGLPQSNTSNFYYSGSLFTSGGTPTGVGLSAILGSSETTPVVVEANKGLSAVLLPVSGASTFIQFRFTAPVASGTTTYLKLKDKPVRNSTLDVAALGVLGLSSTNVIAGELYNSALQPQNYPGSVIPLAAPIANQRVGTAIGSASNPTKTELLLDKNNEWYAAVTPTAIGSYNSVRLTAQFPADLNLLSLANSIKFNVYNAFTDPDGGVCSLKPRYTNEGKATGVSLNLGVAADLLDLTDIVKAPYKAIDNDLTTYSAMSSGILNVGLLNTVSQSFYFDHSATLNDGIRFQLGLHSDLIQLSLLNPSGIKFRAYKGTSEIAVYEKNLGEITQLLGLNLLNLITINGSPQQKKLDLTFNPNVEFDRFELVLDQGVLSLGVLSDALRIYDVALAPSLPVITVQPTAINSTDVCEGSTASFSVTANASGGGSITGYEWQYLDGTSWVSAPGGSSNTLNINTTNAMNNRWYRTVITGGNASCPQQVISNEAQLTVRPKALAADISGSDQVICSGLSATLTASSTVPGPAFKWYSNPELTGPVLSTTVDLTVSPNVTTDYYVTVEGTSKCQNAPNTAKKMTVTVHPRPITPPILPQTN